MTRTTTKLRGVAAGIGAVGLALAGTFAMGAPAYADEVGPDQPGAPTSGTLTINKYDGAPLGEGESLSDRETLDGVEFTVTRVGRSENGDCSPIDLTNAADWADLEDLFDSAPATPAAPFCLVPSSAVTAVTANGQAVFDLEVGMYFAQETDPGNNPIVSSVPDFYVSIPTSVGDSGQGWNYDVVADPKNQTLDAPSKTIADQTDLVVGDNVTWNISVPVPTLNNQETFTSASVTDVLDSRLSYVRSTVALNGTELVEGTHYNVDADGVTWTFTQAGHTLLNDAMGGEITIDLVTSVDAVGDGSIPNEDYSSQFNGTSIPGEQVPYTYWGQLSITKIDDSDDALPLEGAEFQVFDSAGDVCPADAPNSGSIATGTSDTNGVVQWAGVTPTSPLGLHVANSEDGELSNPSKNYCVYETVVPAGHTAMAVDNPVTITPGEDNVNAFEVINPRTEGPELPLTGAGGTWLMTIGGLILVALGVTTVIVSRRRRAAMAG